MVLERVVPWACGVARAGMVTPEDAKKLMVQIEAEFKAQDEDHSSGIDVLIEQLDVRH